jgi:hypothetical protein
MYSVITFALIYRVYDRRTKPELGIKNNQGRSRKIRTYVIVTNVSCARLQIYNM